MFKELWCVIASIAQHYLPKKILNMFSPHVASYWKYYCCKVFSNLPKAPPSLPSPLLGSYILPMNKTSSSFCESQETRHSFGVQIRYSMRQLKNTRHHICRPYTLHPTYRRAIIFIKFLCVSPSIIQLFWGVSNFSSFHFEQNQQKLYIVKWYNLIF